MMKRVGRVAILVATVLVSAVGAGVARAQSPTASVLQRVDSMAAAEFAHDSIASLTIGVVTADGLVWTKSYGFADMSTRRLANRQSVYRIGSITKMFTALMLQQLVAAGKIRLTDPVERVIVANADQLAVVVALANPEPRTRLIDRCLVALNLREAAA